MMIMIGGKRGGDKTMRTQIISFHSIWNSRIILFNIPFKNERLTWYQLALHEINMATIKIQTINLFFKILLIFRSNKIQSFNGKILPIQFSKSTKKEDLCLCDNGKNSDSEDVTVCNRQQIPIIRMRLFSKRAPSH